MILTPEQYARLPLEAQLRLAELNVEEEELDRFDLATGFREQAGQGPHGQRLAFWRTNARFPVVAAGRRSGKTILSEWKLERRIWDVKPWPDARYFFAGPTQGQAEQIGWQRMIDLIQSSSNASRIHKINLSDLIITVDIGMINGKLFQASFHIIGLDSPQRMEGRGWDGGIGDERADWKAGIWSANLRPALADRKGFCYFVGTPDFEGPSAFEFKEQFEKGLSRQDGYESFTWTSAEVVDREEIDLARRDSSPAIFRQEYEASWESAPGRAYPDFVRSVHVRPIEYDPEMPLMISCDFNRRYHNWGEYQYANGEYRILSDIFVYGGTVEAMILETKSRLQQKNLPDSGKGVLFYGDYSGTQRRAEATESSWLQIRKAFPDAIYCYEVQPPVTDRIEEVNKFILNAAGESHLQVDPSAVNHIADFERVSRTMAFAGEGGKDGELTHSSTAFGYLVKQHQLALTVKPRSWNSYFSVTAPKI